MRLLPITQGAWQITLGSSDPDDAVTERDGDVIAEIGVWTRDEEGAVVDVKTQELPIVQGAGEPTAPRLVAYLEGWVKALPALVEQASRVDPAFMPIDIICPPALREQGVEDVDGFAALILREDGPMRAWRAEIAGEGPYELDEATWEAFLQTARPESDEELAARRASALDAAMKRLGQVEAKLRAVHGVRLPRHVGVFWGFYSSLSDAELEAYQGLDLYRPFGVLEWFEEGGLGRAPRDGLDERLDARFRCDAPEFLSMLGGSSDGQHFGLWYDDPAHLPSGVVENYARDSAENWWAGPTLLAVVSRHLDEIEGEYLTSEYHEDVAQAACRVRVVREAIDAFAQAEEAALAEDAPDLLLAYEDRKELPEIVCGVGVVGRDGEGFTPPYLASGAHFSGREFRDEPERTRALIADATAVLDRGEPLYALALGRDLHWADPDEFRADALALMTRGYRMLGREALAAIAEVHHANRDLAHVGIYD
ncbi:ADP-ribosylation family protein [Sorangium sp. So ce406]|uniref:ADP-ribosylation family protein n=1 Tax=Sorangium sp. So ce406 TaxID=3133311 RepID=UPI003F5B59DA